MKNLRTSLGGHGEDLAVNFLKQHGYQILERNYRTRWGEIDLIAREQGTICFVEVKTRATLLRGHPFEAITAQKQQKLIKLAQGYLKERSLFSSRARFDVVGIVMSKEGSPQLELLKNAFGLDG